MKKTKCFWIFTGLLIAVIAFCITGTASSMEDKEKRVEESYYQELEERYLQDIKEYLEEAGYRNTGIMLTRTINEEGNREYSISIHNARFDKLSDDEKQELLNGIESKEFQGKGCTFQHSIA